MDEGISWLQVCWTQKRRSLDWDAWSSFELASGASRICPRLEKSQGSAECCVESSEWRHQATMTCLTRVVIKVYLWVRQGCTSEQQAHSRVFKMSAFPFQHFLLFYLFTLIEVNILYISQRTVSMDYSKVWVLYFMLKKTIYKITDFRWKDFPWDVMALTSYNCSLIICKSKLKFIKSVIKLVNNN